MTAGSARLQARRYVACRRIAATHRILSEILDQMRPTSSHEPARRLHVRALGAVPPVPQETVDPRDAQRRGEPRDAAEVHPGVREVLAISAARPGAAAEAAADDAKAAGIDIATVYVLGGSTGLDGAEFLKDHIASDPLLAFEDLSFPDAKDLADKILDGIDPCTSDP